MIKTVIKRDGREESFDIEKLKQSIRVNAIDAALKETEDKINNLVDSVSGSAVQQIKNNNKITSKEIREIVLVKLDEVAPLVAKIWREYDEQRWNS
jgi:transcriptional regulator NrdR family protein